MSDTGHMMHATFYGGPADGGELMLLEPVSQVLTFPMTHVKASVTLANPQPANLPGGAGAWVNATPSSAYRLAMTDDGRVIRDNRRRIVYRYLPAVRPAAPHPTEGEPHE